MSERCPRCKGNGRVEMLEHCPSCKGSGLSELETADREAAGGSQDPRASLAPRTLTPPPDSLRVWVKKTPATVVYELDARRWSHEVMEEMEREGWHLSEYLPATDLEQLREALGELVEALDYPNTTLYKRETRWAMIDAALSHARDLLAGGSDEA